MLAKAVLLNGSKHPFDILGGTGAQALAVDDMGTLHRTPGLAAHLGDAALPTRLVPIG